MISYYKSISQPAEDFTSVKFGIITRHPNLQRVCEKIAAANGDHDRISALKRKLPAVTWQAWQPEGEMRSADKCQPNGLFMIDVDHIDNPKSLYEKIKAEKANWDKDVIMLAHITPSGKGLRIVAKRYNATMSIPECQSVFCSHYGIECDKAVKDVSRLSFLVPESYILYIDDNIFTYQGELSTVEQDQQKLGLYNNQPKEPVIVDTKVDAEGDFQGIPIKEIVSEVIERTGGAPVVGERNTRLYEISRILRYIVDFDANKLAAILPTFGLTENEIAQVAQSAVKSNRAERMPDTLWNIIKEREEIKNEFQEAIPEEKNINENIEKVLPPIFSDFSKSAPKDFKAPAVVSLLPVLGTLASTARAKYLDGVYHSPSFISVLVAPQASGKSFARRIVEKCLAPLEAEDMKARLDEQMYRKAVKEAKNSKQQPKEPETMVRCVPASISIAKLLKRLDNARGLHLFTFCEEIDTVAKSNGSGAWAQKSDIYRNAFDNAKYGQDYMTDISYSATLKVFYNLLLLGTPNAVNRFFKDPEDGLVSRISFCAIPDQFGMDMPEWKPFTKEQESKVENLCRKLLERHSQPNEPRYYDLSTTNEILSSWLKEQRDIAVLSVDRARDTARRRAAVVGFRAALIATAIEEITGGDCSYIPHFAIKIADMYLNTMLSMYGESMAKVLDVSTRGKGNTMHSLFNQLNDVFTISDLYSVVSKNQIKTPIRKILSLWRTRNLIEDVEPRKTFKKVK